VELGDTPAEAFSRTPFRIEGQPTAEKGREIFASYAKAARDFSRCTGIRLLQGRDFRETDRLGSPQVVIVNESLANKFWPV